MLCWSSPDLSLIAVLILRLLVGCRFERSEGAARTERRATARATRAARAYIAGVAAAVEQGRSRAVLVWEEPLHGGGGTVRW